MSVTINTGLTSVTGTVDSTTVPPGQGVGQTTKIKAFSHTFGAAGKATYYTPTAGKVFYVTDLVISGNAVVDIVIGDNLAASFAHDTLYTNTLLGYSAVSFQHVRLAAPLPISTTLDVYATAAGTFQVTAIGYEE